MSQLLVHAYRIHAKNIKRKRICQFNDIHLAEWDSLSSDAEKEKASYHTTCWEDARFYFARRYGEPHTDAQALPAKVFFNQLLDASKDADALILAGDVVEFYTDANARLLEESLQAHPVPYLIVCGNHDEPETFPATHPMHAAGLPVQTLDLGDMVILGFDNSKRIITKEQIAALREALLENKPILITMHIPIMTEGNRELLQRCGEYYQLNHEGCPEENLEFIDIIRKNADKIIAVTCGHLHFANESEICPGVMQYVSSQGLIGSISFYDIGE